MMAICNLKSRLKRRQNLQAVAHNTFLKMRCWIGSPRSVSPSSTLTTRRSCIEILNPKTFLWPSVVLSNLEISALLVSCLTQDLAPRPLSVLLTISRLKSFVKKGIHSNRIFGLSVYFFTRWLLSNHHSTLDPSINLPKRLSKESTRHCHRVSDQTLLELSRNFSKKTHQSDQLSIKS